MLWDPAFYHSGVDVAPRESMGIAAKYTSGQASDSSYFDWSDAASDDARTLAEKFVDRFPRVAREGSGWDYQYAGWFQRLLGAAERGFLPVVLWDAIDIPFDRVPLRDVRPASWIRDDPTVQDCLPLPPGGELEQDFKGI
jgi:hypothetical protein